MISLNTWKTLYTGRYGNQEITILYEHDIFVTMLKSREQDNSLVQVYKVFYAKGDVETFIQTLPYQAILYFKHLEIGESNNFKFVLLNSETEYVDTNTLSYHIDKKIQQLNKQVSSIISVVNSYNIKLISLKVADQKARNYFFSDPDVLKILSNLPPAIDFSGSNTLDKLIIGKKKDVNITTSLENIKSVSFFGVSKDSRFFALKVFIENYLLSSKKVIIFDDSKKFKSLSYPQQDPNILKKYDINMDPFGFPVKNLDFKDFKIPLGSVPLEGFFSMFNFSKKAKKIISKVYSLDLITIDDLINKINNIKSDDDITEFEKQRIISKLTIVKRNYDYFDKSDYSEIFEQKYKNIGSVKLIDIDKSNSFYIYLINYIINLLNNTIKEEVLIVLPESKEVFENLHVGLKIYNILTNNYKLCYFLSSKNLVDFKFDNISDVIVNTVSKNDAVIYYPKRDPLRLLLRPTLTTSDISFKEVNRI